MTVASLWVEREPESAQLSAFVARLLEGLSGSLAVVGEAGSGKTTLVGRLRSSFGDVRFLFVVGTESEQFLPYAGLQQLLLPLMAAAGDLPPPQRDALALAFGLVDGDAPSPFLIGIATLTLLAQAGRDQPVLCLIDDGQWLDAESLAAIGFVGRRVEAESVGLLVTVRADLNADLPGGLGGWASMRLAGLDFQQSVNVLAGRYGSGISGEVVRELFAGTRGNPLALVSVADWLSADQRLGRAPLPDPLPVGPLLEQLFSAQISLLPAATRRLLLLVSAGPGDSAALWRACSLAGLSAHHIDAAVAAGVVALNGAVTFRHPLVRSAVYSGADAGDRRAAHAVLARATDQLSDPDRRAWHLAAAALEPDEEVAAELERSSARAQSRGGLTARAALLRRASDLSPAPRERIRRLLLAARATSITGSWTSVQELLTLLPSQLSGSAAIERDRMRGALAMAQSQPHSYANVVLESLRGSDARDIRATRDALLEAVHVVLLTGTFGDQQIKVGVARAVMRAVEGDLESFVAADRLMKAFASRILDGDTSTFYALLRAALPVADSDEQISDATTLALTWYAYGELWNLTGQRTFMHNVQRRLREKERCPVWR